MGSQLSKNEKKLAVVAVVGLVTAGVVALVMYEFIPQIRNKPSETRDGQPEIQSSPRVVGSPRAEVTERVESQGGVKPSFNEDQQIQEIIKSIQVEQSGDVLTLKSITQILEKSLDLARNDYIQLTLDNRRTRRELRKSDGKRYQQLVMDYNEKIEQTLEKKQEEICKALGITVDLFQESVMALMERGFFQQFFMIQASIRQKIKESIPGKKPINLEQLKSIVEYQLQVLQKKPRDLQDMIAHLSGDQESAQLIPLAVNTILADWVFEKFQIEEEDMIKMMQNPENFADQQMQNLMMQLEQAMYELMGPMGNM